MVGQVGDTEHSVRMCHVRLFSAILVYLHTFHIIVPINSERAKRNDMKGVGVYQHDVYPAAALCGGGLFEHVEK